MMIPKQLQENKFRFLLLKGKIAIEKEWQKERNYIYNSPQISLWTENIGFLCGNGYLVVDIDDNSLVEEIKKVLPPTFSVKGSKGIHLYFKTDCSKSAKLPKIDLKGDGGYIVIPPSIHPETKKPYTIIDDLPIAEISRTELNAALMIYSEKSYAIDINTLLSGVKEGCRNDSCLKIATYYRQKGNTKEETLSLLESWNTKNQPPLSSQEIHLTLNSAFQKEEPYNFNFGLKKLSQSLKIDCYQDNVESFWENKPFFYDKNKIFWFWNQAQSCYELTDETELMNLIDEELGFLGQTITGGLRNNYIEAFKRVGRKHIPKEAPSRWVQFKKRVISLRSGNEYEAMPNYFFTNPIPWDIGETEDTPTIDKLFFEWVGEKNKITLYEILAYCCYREYPIQVLFCFCGIGRNGKTQFLKLLAKFLGKNNVCNTDLDLIAGQNRSRFETFKLYKKLAGVMGETNFGILASSSLLKRLTGGDMIGYEMKGKNPFDDYSYCKLLINSNSLPSSEDTSEGFYRRWIIIDFPNQFNEGTDIINTIPEREYCCLARKIKRLLPELLQKCSFTGQGDTEYRKMKYIMASNPLPMFIKDFYKEDPAGWVRYSELYSYYCTFLNKQKKRIVSKKEFSKVLNMEGYECRRTSKNNEMDYYVEGLSPLSPITVNSQLDSIYGKRSGILMQSERLEIIPLIKYIENNDFADNQEKIMEIFGDDLVTNALIKGEIFNFRPGWLKKT